MGVSLIVAFLSLLDVTLVNVAVPSMRDALQASDQAVQWVVSGYSLTYGLVLVAGGRLGDAIGCRPVLILGLTGFVFASAGVGLASDIGVVLVARFVQGVCVGLLVPQAAALIQQSFVGDERGKAFGFYGMTVALSALVGPIFAGTVITVAPDQGWRWLFWVNVPVGVIALAAVVRIVPPLPRRSPPQRLRLDLGGMALLGLGILSFLAPIIMAHDTPATLFLVVFAPPLLWAFLVWEVRATRRGRAPLLDVSLLRTIPSYGGGLAVGSLYFAGFAGLFLVVSVYLQDGRRLSPLETGALMTPFAAGSALTAVVTGGLVARFGRRVTLFALSTMMLGVSSIATLVPANDLGTLRWLLPLTLFFTGLGSGGVTSPNFTITLAGVPPTMGGAAGGALQTGQRIGAAVGAALLMAVYWSVSQRVNAGAGLAAALLAGSVVLAIAWLVTLRELRRGMTVERLGARAVL